MTRSDRALVRAVVSRQAGADAELVARYRPLVLRLCQGRYGLDGEGSEEVFQALMVRLWEDDFRALRTWRGEGRLSTYLTVIVTNLCLRRRRGEARQPVNGLPREPEIAAAESSPLQGVLEEERAAAVAACLRRLRPRERLLLALAYHDEHAPKEIAVLLDLRPGAARKALFDARRRLSRLLRRHYPGLFSGAEPAQRAAQPRATPRLAVGETEGNAQGPTRSHLTGDESP